MLDVQNLMIKLGAENAANLDGGSSSLMYYKGEYINDCASLIGPRDMPTAIIVK
jgi:exopolysaccharide biosynthesis protein